MQGIKKQLWDMYVSESEKMIELDPDIILNYGSMHTFGKIFDTLYKKIKNMYMKDSVTYLDRHKVAAIIILALVETDALQYSKKLENSVFWGNYILSISVGLSYMLNMLNSELNTCGCQRPIQKYIFPEIFMDNISYLDVMCRDIHILNSQNSSLSNVIGLAHRLFLIEYLTLKENDINTDILKHY